MNKYWNLFKEGYTGYADYLYHEITHPAWNNYFYWLIVVSLFFFILEVVIPWRKKQPVFRKDFWLDVFYMFFNFFLFSLIIYSAASNVIVNLFNDGISWITGGFDLQANNPMNSFPMWAVLLIGFLVRDFVQWWIHRLLHRSDTLWEFHKVHHSVEEMGFAAHLRYHWMENIVYRTIEYIPLALLGIGLYDFFIIHIFTLAWGHYNHSNISVSGYVTGGILGALLGTVAANGLLDITLFGSPTLLAKFGIIIAFSLAGGLLLGKLMKYLFNSPEMHIWHHSYELPETRRFGVNFGLTLAIWDYLFKTAYIPHDGQDIRLGFPGVEKFPHGFAGQATYGFKDNQKE
ncbi:sterol desaturase family protein [Neolewinella persica]|uniref:sterol desaturase family protein n=1 Tax=Neolewinella persica TaxID=70998 RepID=UPI0003705A65|nr:sterol desaturase family protein [Neolewinella persica]